MRELPKDHRFPDGDWIHYWRDKEDPEIIWGQLMRKNWTTAGRKFTYEGDRDGPSEDSPDAA